MFADINFFCEDEKKYVDEKKPSILVREEGTTPTAHQMLIGESTKVASINRGFDDLVYSAIEHVKSTGYLSIDKEMDELVDRVVNEAISKEKKVPLTRRV